MAQLGAFLLAFINANPNPTIRDNAYVAFADEMAAREDEPPSYHQETKVKAKAAGKNKNFNDRPKRKNAARGCDDKIHTVVTLLGKRQGLLENGSEVTEYLVKWAKEVGVEQWEPSWEQERLIARPLIDTFEESQLPQPGEESGTSMDSHLNIAGSSSVVESSSCAGPSGSQDTENMDVDDALKSEPIRGTSSRQDREHSEEDSSDEAPLVDTLAKKRERNSAVPSQSPSGDDSQESSDDEPIRATSARQSNGNNHNQRGRSDSSSTLEFIVVDLPSSDESDDSDDTLPPPPPVKAKPKANPTSKAKPKASQGKEGKAEPTLRTKRVLDMLKDDDWFFDEEPPSRQPAIAKAKPKEKAPKQKRKATTTKASAPKRQKKGNRTAKVVAPLKPPRVSKPTPSSKPKPKPKLKAKPYGGDPEDSEWNEFDSEDDYDFMDLD
ncbi:hypothetical protein B0J14DRAFT_570658 [Halenospora varia]|nr:hypothetical protein B0J14DRAFT_570658 [Halenospora varia]